MTHRSRLEPQVRCMNTVHQQTVRGVLRLRIVHVSVLFGVHAIVRNVHKVVEVVREDVHSLP